MTAEHSADRPAAQGGVVECAGRLVLNPFLERQTADSRYSHFVGTAAELLELVEACRGRHARAGAQAGVVHVALPAARFRAGVVAVSDRIGLAATWVRRQPGTPPYIVITAAAGTEKPAAVRAEAVLCRSDFLGERATPGADWEVLTVAASPQATAEPPHPVTLARNQLNLPGAAATRHGRGEFARSLAYWLRHVHAAPPEEADCVTDPALPALTAAYLRDALGPSYAVAWTRDAALLEEPPPGGFPESPLFWAFLPPGTADEDGTGAARAVWYWARRPLLDPELGLGGSHYPRPRR